MRWRTGRRSSNVEDRRGTRPAMGRGLKLGGGAGIVLLVAFLLLGGDPGQLVSILEGGGALAPPVSQPASNKPVSDEGGQFVSTVLADTEDTWSALFQQHGSRYQQPKLVLYTGATTTACGYGQAATGPFYCPADSKVYLDLSFFRQLEQLGAPGDFAIAYVIAHEIGHHVQNLTGTSSKVRQAQARVSKSDANELSVLTELQADCYAGVWAHHAHKQRQVLEKGDIEEGLAAASAVGDDRLQRRAGRTVHPDSFTHGSAAQRSQWFKCGLQTGSIKACDTYTHAQR